jgi:hypothetical protein
MKKKTIDRKKFGGKFVATKSFTNLNVVASGTDPIKVYNEAIEKGIKDPVINYIHQEGIICLY